MSNHLTPEQIVQLQLNYYNNQDIDGFVSTYAVDVLIMDHPSGTVSIRGRQQLREVYEQVFANHPNSRAQIKNRMTFAHFVIDLEEVSGRVGREPFEAVAIYEVVGEVITKVWFLEGAE
ncbi:nuclear transport factor 2 family protein [Paenibacillus sp. 481]|uniref:nuclear transport factor 2 family protein n=1 Tax=Paenibacillus sp. 481 TaxID=2835869 RepID=UPI001E36DD2D|nr:nuclear transport factor 2 family protein [Paenibacillus sp. 481]UHA73680.1 nuclear transport factor 2 family protein [Paenibacillus sp. 481]